MVRHGRVGEDVALARYAVAFAHEHQRRRERVRSFALVAAMGLALTLVCAGLAADAFLRSHEMRGVLFGGFAVFFAIYCLWRPWQARGSLDEAEMSGREFLRRSGAPYVPGGPPSAVYVPPLLRAGSLVLGAALYIPLFGLFTLALDEESLSVGRAFSVGASHWVDVIVLIIGAFYARSRNQLGTGRSTPEYQHLRDLE
jgi:hypothetical protein